MPDVIRAKRATRGWAGVWAMLTFWVRHRRCWSSAITYFEAGASGPETFVCVEHEEALEFA